MKLIALKATRNGPSGSRVPPGDTFEPKTEAWGKLLLKVGLAKEAGTEEPAPPRPVTPSRQTAKLEAELSEPAVAKTVARKTTARKTVAKKTTAKVVTGTRNRSMAGNTDAKGE